MKRLVGKSFVFFRGKVWGGIIKRRYCFESAWVFYSILLQHLLKDDKTGIMRTLFFLSPIQRPLNVMLPSSRYIYKETQKQNHTSNTIHSITRKKTQKSRKRQKRPRKRKSKRTRRRSKTSPSSSPRIIEGRRGNSLREFREADPAVAVDIRLLDHLRQLLRR